MLQGGWSDRFRRAAARGALQKEEAAGQRSCVVGAVSNHGCVQERHAYKDRNTKARSSAWLCAALSDLERRSARAEEGALNTVGTFVLLLPLCWRVTYPSSQEGDAKILRRSSTVFLLACLSRGTGGREEGAQEPRDTPICTRVRPLHASCLLVSDRALRFTVRIPEVPSCDQHVQPP